ncbi:MAG: M48 family metalloprotease [Lentisphaeria bacterium]|nr:M48 family metalloprotease [Lentisphaeria bacterium]NQZ67122.1 M48 family metalloprotease [Lentisphaeria bacterium]
MQIKYSDSELEAIREAVINQLIQIPKLDKPKTSLWYMAWLLVSVAAFLFVIIVYLLLVFGVGAALVYHAIFNFETLIENGLAFTFLYILPLFIGGGFLFFLIKPIFNRHKQDVFEHKINPQDEPFIYAFVNEIARITGAPKPKEIILSTEVNAHAAFRRGLWSVLLPGRDMQLSLGLPIINGLSMPELAGVIAHEFGHFSQGAGMNVSYILRRFNFWLARIVYERDRWDYQVQYSDDWVILKPGIWIVRKLMWCLMLLGNCVSSHLLRQMEYDADKNEVILTGTDCFLKTNDTFTKLGFADRISVNIALTLLKDEGRLADNWGEFVVNNLDELEDDDFQKELEEMKEAKTGFWDTHPSMKDRNNAAKKLNMDGHFSYEGHPVYVAKLAELKENDEYSFVPFNNILLTDMYKLSRTLTIQLYKNALGDEFKDDKLIPVERIIRNKKAYKNTFDASKRFFYKTLTGLYDFELNIDNPETVNFLAERKNLIANRESLKSSHEKNQKLVEDMYKLEDQAINIHYAMKLRDAGYRINSNEFDVKSVNKKGLKKELEQADTKLQDFQKEYREIADQHTARVFSSLRILQTTDFNDISENSGFINELNVIWPIFEMLNRKMKEIRELNREFQAHVLLFENCHANPIESAFRHFERESTRIYKQFKEFRNEFKEIPYPFDHNFKTLKISKFLFEKFPAKDEQLGILEAGSEIIDNYYTLYFRLWGRLAEIAEFVELELGLQPVWEEDDFILENRPQPLSDEILDFKKLDFETVEIFTQLETDMQAESFIESTAELFPEDSLIEKTEPQTVKKSPPPLPVQDETDIPVQTEEPLLADEYANVELKSEMAVPIEDLAGSEDATDTDITAITGPPLTADEDENLELKPDAEYEPALAGIAERKFIDGAGLVNCRFLIRSKLYEDENYVTYLAVDEFTERLVNFECLKSSSPLNDDPDFEKHVNILKACHHANITDVYSLITVEDLKNFDANNPLKVVLGNTVIIKEYVKGRSFEDYRQISKTGSFIDYYSLFLMKAAAAIDYAGTKELPFAIFKSNLILIDDHNEVKLNLFIGNNHVDEIVLDHLFKAPEINEGDLSTIQSLQYNLAVIICEALNFDIQFITNIQEEDCFVEALNLRTNNVLKKALSENPDDRYASCMEFVSELIQAKEIRVGDYLSDEQQKWLEDHSYNKFNQIELIRIIKGEAVATDKEPQIFNDTFLRGYVEQDQLADIESSKKDKVAWYIRTGALAYLVLAISYWLFADFAFIIKKDFEFKKGDKIIKGSYRAAFDDPILFGSGFPTISQDKVYPNNIGWIVFFIEFDGVNNEPCYLSFIDVKGNNLYNSETANIRQGGYNFAWVHKKRSLAQGPLQVKIFVDKKLIGTEQIEVTHSFFLTIWFALLSIMLFVGAIRAADHYQYKE